MVFSIPNPKMRIVHSGYGRSLEIKCKCGETHRIGDYSIPEDRLHGRCVGCNDVFVIDTRLPYEEGKKLKYEEFNRYNCSCGSASFIIENVEYEWVLSRITNQGNILDTMSVHGKSMDDAIRNALSISPQTKPKTMQIYVHGTGARSHLLEILIPKDTNYMTTWHTIRKTPCAKLV